MQPIKTSLFVLMGLLSLPGCGSTQNDATTGLLENKVPGTATLSGKITAPAACEAARMYAQNMDRNVIYMVYTGDGNYQAVAMFPGNYEVWVEKVGFEAERREIQLEAGGAASLDFSLREVPAQHAGQGAFLGLDRGDRAKDARSFPMTNSIRRLPSGPWVREPVFNVMVRASSPSFIRVPRTGMRPSTSCWRPGFRPAPSTPSSVRNWAPVPSRTSTCPSTSTRSSCEGGR